MSEFKTPGVYVKEVTTFPPSVAQVETAIPAFIGYTDLAIDKVANDLRLVPKRITSLLEYETHFGKAKKESIVLKDTVDKGLTLEKPAVDFLMYYSMQMYFANGGGPCYIVSVGDYGSGVDKEELKAGLDKVRNEDEPTLLVFPDAVSLTDQEKFYAIYQDALDQAEDLKNRFVILDTYYGDSTTESGDDDLNTIEYFRQRVNPSTYGAVYFPHLKTVLNYTFDETDTEIVHTGLQPAGPASPFFVEAIAELTALAGQAVSGATQQTLGDLLDQAIATVETVNETADTQISLVAANALLASIEGGTTATFGAVATAINTLKTNLNTAEDKEGHADGKTLESLRLSDSALYNQIKKEIESLAIVLPPSSAIAGIYGKVDSTKGVWKAPANIGLSYVTGPSEKVSHDEQAGLNVDDVDGKSINVIRSFAGKGTLVWGARTLYGNDNEWKYVPVRRLFIMVEESVKRATERFLFEPNDANTWVRAKGMIKNYLTTLWMDGALAGSTPEEAFYVSVGGETISPQDILEGRMNIEIGLAAVRPAEFIILRFSHKLQES
jgi:uncharacterized protein